ncbi:MAG: hypothetical protein NTW59_04615 [Candidatus Diapherotrites archaeon]|nr:hypothetical protein [Candidatus Diapherotrites archaeon]
MPKKFKYPRLTALAAAMIAAYFLFSVPAVGAFFSNLDGWGYLLALFAGILYSYGFTAPFATGMLLSMKPDNVFIAAAIAGVGSLFDDMVIFAVVRHSFMGEFESIKRTKAARAISGFVGRAFGEKIKSALTYALAAFIIASPLPDEAGVTLLAGLSKIKPLHFAAISLLLNTTGILIILSIG